MAACVFDAGDIYWLLWPQSKGGVEVMAGVVARFELWCGYFSVVKG